MQHAPSAVVLPMLTIVPLIYSVPVALITAELATSWPVDGGVTASISMAAGPVFGGHNACV